MASSPRPPIQSLQAGRALAALAVVALHASLSVGAFLDPLPHHVGAVLSYGYLGVDFFFVLSGFIIYYASAHRVGRPGWAGAYAESRLTRIYVPYLPVGLAVALGYVLIGGSPDGYQWNWLATATLLPGTGHPALSVAWTLQHELLFYALAGILLYSRKLLAGLIIWDVLILAAAIAGIGSETIWLNPINLEFSFGVFAAWLVTTGRLRTSLLLPLALGAAAILAFFAAGDRLHSAIFGLGIAALLVPLVHAELAAKVRVPAFLVLLGNASYAIYLVHNPLLSVLMRIAAKVQMDWASGLAFGFVASAVIGLVYHLCYEKPALKLARRLVRGRRFEAPATT